MKTILHLHILVRLVALTCIVYSLYRLIVAWPAVSKILDLMEKKKTNSMLRDEVFDPSEFTPFFLDIFLSPIIILAGGILAFIATRKIVEFIIGRKEIKALIQADGREEQIKAR